MKKKLAIAFGLIIPVGFLVHYAPELSFEDKNPLRIQAISCNDEGEIVVNSLASVYANELASLKNTKGEDLFSCKNIAEYKELGGSLEYVFQLASLRTIDDEDYFSGEDIVKYKKVGGTFEFAQKKSNEVDEKGDNLVRGNQLPQMYFLGLDLEQIINFKDTEKPNALFVYPTKDERRSFLTEGTLDLYSMVNEIYDLKVVIASTEDEVYDGLYSIPKIELFALGGHGNFDQIELGEMNSNDYLSDEKYKIDLMDNEFEFYINLLHPQAVIFLNSCKNAKGGRSRYNIANYISGFANERTVIASKDSFSSREMIINKNTLYPFQIWIVVEDKGVKKDVTYIPEGF